MAFEVCGTVTSTEQGQEIAVAEGISKVQEGIMSKVLVIDSVLWK